MVRLIYEIIDGKVSASDGCSQLWKLADEYGLLKSGKFDEIIQLDSDLERSLAGASGTELAARLNAFEEKTKADILAALKTILLLLKEPVFTIQYAAKAFLNGHRTLQETIIAMHGPIAELAINEQEPYAAMYNLAFEFHQIPPSSERHLWHSELLIQKENENAALSSSVSKETTDACRYILEHPIARPY